jgi:transposase-like protein
MDLARSVYSRDFKISVMRAMDAGESGGKVARRLQISPKLIERWRAEWRARGEASFPGSGRRALPKLSAEERSVAELERKIGQLTLENDFLKKALQHFREYHPPAVVSGGAACAARSSKPVKAVRK